MNKEPFLYFTDKFYTIKKIDNLFEITFEHPNI